MAKKKAATKPKVVPELWTVTEVAKQLQCSPRHIWRLLERGQFPAPLRLGEKILRWRRSDIEALAAGVLQPVPHKPTIAITKRKKTVEPAPPRQPDAAEIIGLDDASYLGDVAAHVHTELFKLKEWRNDILAAVRQAMADENAATMRLSKQRDEYVKRYQAADHTLILLAMTFHVAKTVTTSNTVSLEFRDERLAAEFRELISKMATYLEQHPCRPLSP